MVVLYRSDAVVPELFHLILWQVVCNYYYLTAFGKSVVPQLDYALEKAFTNISNNSFHKGWT
jgi:hypothetical protein